MKSIDWNTSIFVVSSKTHVCKEAYLVATNWLSNRYGKSTCYAIRFVPDDQSEEVLLLCDEEGKTDDEEWTITNEAWPAKLFQIVDYLYGKKATSSEAKTLLSDFFNNVLNLRG